MKKEPKTVYLLESVNLDKRTGVLKYKPEFPKNGSWEKYHVGLSGLLVDRIKNGKLRGLKSPQEYVGTKFVSTLTSKVYAENPFRLTQWSPGKGINVPINYRLELLFEAYSPKSILSDVVGNQISKVTDWKRTHKSKFKRYVEKIGEKMRKDLGDAVVIVNPTTGKIFKAYKA